MSAERYVLRCASGALHIENGEPPTADNHRCASEAADFMDEPRDDSPWTCGPHQVERLSSDV